MVLRIKVSESPGFPSPCPHAKHIIRNSKRKTHLHFQSATLLAYLVKLVLNKKYASFQLEVEKIRFLQIKIHGITYRISFLVIQCLFCQHISSMLVSKNIFETKIFFAFHDQNVHAAYWNSNHFKCFKILTFISIQLHNFGRETSIMFYSNHMVRKCHFILYTVTRKFTGGSKSLFCISKCKTVFLYGLNTVFFSPNNKPSL